MEKSIYTKRYSTFCSLLRKARRSADLTQVQVAEALGKTQSFVNKYESGERRLDIVEFLDIAKVIGADVDAILKKIS